MSTDEESRRMGQRSPADKLILMGIALLLAGLAWFGLASTYHHGVIQSELASHWGALTIAGVVLFSAFSTWALLRWQQDKRPEWFFPTLLLMVVLSVALTVTLWFEPSIALALVVAAVSTSLCCLAAKFLHKVEEHSLGVDEATEAGWRKHLMFNLACPALVGGMFIGLEVSWVDAAYWFGVAVVLCGALAWDHRRVTQMKALVGWAAEHLPRVGSVSQALTPEEQLVQESWNRFRAAGLPERFNQFCKERVDSETPEPEGSGPKARVLSFHPEGADGQEFIRYPHDPTVGGFIEWVAQSAIKASSSYDAYEVTVGTEDCLDERLLSGLSDVQVWSPEVGREAEVTEVFIYRPEGEEEQAVCLRLLGDWAVRGQLVEALPRSREESEAKGVRVQHLEGGSSHVTANYFSAGGENDPMMRLEKREDNTQSLLSLVPETGGHKGEAAEFAPLSSSLLRFMAQLEADEAAGSGVRRTYSVELPQGLPDSILEQLFSSVVGRVEKAFDLGGSKLSMILGQPSTAGQNKFPPVIELHFADTEERTRFCRALALEAKMPATSSLSATSSGTGMDV